MLISLSLENWMSFRSPTKFSMVASRERQHGERVPRLENYQIRILPIAAIYGGNASGKTNLFKALSFIKGLVVTGTQPKATIPVKPYLLDAESDSVPTRFALELLIDTTIYEFSFSVTEKEVVEERLVQILNASERVLYHRRKDVIEFDVSLAKDQFLNFAFQGTQDNQLFLTNSVSQKVKNFRPVYDWFTDSLELIAPDSRFGPFEQLLQADNSLHAPVNKMLMQLDTGITHLGGDEISLDHLAVPEDLIQEIRNKVTDEVAVRLLDRDESILFSRKDGKVVANKLVSYHSKRDGSDAKFEISQESDGSRRVIDLLPAILAVSATKSKKVVVIDELDRSLHTLLTRQLIEAYLLSCSHETRSQVLFTTHDVLLMDQDLFRRDEMWVAERDRSGVSSLISFNAYKDVRYDKDIRKSYLQGRMGGIPHILTDTCLLQAEHEKVID